MNQATFDKLSLEEQMHYIIQHGTLILSNRNHLYKVFLFSLDNFFVELWAYGQSNKLARVRTTSSYEDLATFADLISIPDLNL